MADIYDRLTRYLLLKQPVRQYFVHYYKASTLLKAHAYIHPIDLPPQPI